MKSLFLRVFLSFWLAMGVIVVAGSALTAFVTWKRFDALQRIEPSDVADSALVPLKQGGLPALREWLQEVDKSETTVRTYVLDMHGQDVIGRPLTDRIQRRVTRMASLGYLADADNNPPPLMADPLRTSPQIIGPDGAVYTIFFDYSRRAPLGLLGAPGVTIALLSVALSVSALVSWWLAHYISRPVARLQTSARALAAGNLEARVGEDISIREDELGVLARDFDRMAERIRSLLASKEALLRYVSHELRSPLARLRVALSLARREGADKAREFDRMERETERLDALIGQILRFSRLAGDDPSIKPQRVDLSLMLAEVVEDARLEGRGDEKAVVWEPGAHVEVMGSSEALRSAIDNVMRNALRYTPKQSQIEVQLHLDTDATSGRKHVRISIRDHGRGVPESDLERIFEPFYRVVETGDREGGSGLGLAITARVLNVHGGRVSARNAPDGGLIVELSLPVAA
jgi:two-component system OmpR family sensor kinase